MEVEYNRIEESVPLFTNNDFTLKKSLKEIVLYTCINGEIFTMENILANLKAHKSQSFKLEFDKLEKGLFLYCYNISDFLFDFIFGKFKGEKIFKDPIIYYDEKEILWQFISFEQYNYFLNQYNSPQLYCQLEYVNYEPNIFNLIKHNKHGDKIIDYFSFKIYDNNSYETFFKTSSKSFIKNSYENPKKFEKNFDFYFNNNLEGNFYIYDDDSCSRFLFCQELLTLNKKKTRYYFGCSGKGKSISLIGALKYRDNFEMLGSFYINCKTIKSLLKNRKELLVKQLLIDEVLFFNPKSYLKYESSIKYIKSFNFSSNDSYFDLLDDLLNKYTDKNFQYIIAFDQYNNSQDPNKKLNNLLEKYEQKKQFYFLVFSSMNETDIRNIKKKILFGGETNNYNEIKEICNIYKSDLNINSEKKEALEKLGGTFKVLNELKKEKDINNYLKTKKFRYSQKILLFYMEKDDKIENYIDSHTKTVKEIPEIIIGKILSFKIDYEYNKEDLSLIIDNIPFRFFDIKKNDQSIFKVIFAFPLIEEILYYIYNKISLNNSYYSLKKIMDNKGSGLGTIFELKVIDSLYENKKIIKDFDIKEKIEIHTIVPKSNEKINTNLRITLHNNTTYLVVQEIFNGKALDCLIIKVINNVIYVYGFQISIFKEDIFTHQYLIDCFKTMIKNLQLIFCHKIEYKNTFFGYIFDYSRVKEPEYEKMIDKCKIENWKYFFYDADKNFFCDENYMKIEKIDSKVTCPLLNVYRKKTKQIINVKINKILETLNNSIQQKIKLLISEEKHLPIVNLKYIGKNKRPLIAENLVNIFEYESCIKLIFLENKNIISKFINKENLDVSESRCIENGDFTIYEII